MFSGGIEMEHWAKMVNDGRILQIIEIIRNIGMSWINLISAQCCLSSYRNQSKAKVKQMSGFYMKRNTGLSKILLLLLKMGDILTEKLGR